MTLNLVVTVSIYEDDDDDDGNNVLTAVVDMKSYVNTPFTLVTVCVICCRRL